MEPKPNEATNDFIYDGTENIQTDDSTITYTDEDGENVVDVVDVLDEAGLDQQSNNPPLPPLNAKSPNEHSNKSSGIRVIVGVTSASLVAVMVLGSMYALRRRRDRNNYIKHDDESTNDNIVEDEVMRPVSSFDEVSSTDEVTSKDTTYSVVAPAGKLGLNIRNSSQEDTPVVDAVKETSALSGQVQAGDLLVSVDEIDCRGLGAEIVTEMICERSSCFARRFVFQRRLQVEEV